MNISSKKRNDIPCLQMAFKFGQNNDYKNSSNDIENLDIRK